MKPCTDKTKFLLLVIGFFYLQNCFSQKPEKEFSENSFSAEDYSIIKKTVSNQKEIPAQFQKQILIALTYFPELEDTRIILRIKHVHTPLASRPSWTSILRNNENRVFVITISDSSDAILTPILLKNMPFNAQVGVIGHELSHISDFISKNSIGLMRVGLGNLSQHFLDRFEYRTDSICIAHGLGYQLLSWSIFVRQVFNDKNWDGADNIDKGPMDRERYMNPSTIRRRIAQSPLYQ